VAGVSKVGALARATALVEHREGGDPSSNRKSPGRTSYEPVTLERGVTHDEEFERWANKVWNFGSGLGAEASLKDFRKDIQIELYNEAGQLAITYNVYRCWDMNRSEPQCWRMIGKPGGRVLNVRRSTIPMGSPLMPPILLAPTGACNRHEGGAKSDPRNLEDRCFL
jgi:phage tail-like protein